MSNEAAERLREDVELLDVIGEALGYPIADDPAWQARLTAHRRATVERIGPVLKECIDLLEWYGRKAADNWYLNDEVQEAITKGRAILDEEAAR